MYLKLKIHAIYRQKNPNIAVEAFLWARITNLHGQVKYCRAVRKCPVDTCRRKKPPTFVGGFCVRVTYLPG